MNTISTTDAVKILKAALLLSIVFASYFVARSSLVSHSEMALAITFDLSMTLPILYLIFIRKTKINKLTAIPVFIFGIFFASLILPADNQQFLKLLKTFALPMIELGILSYAGYIIYKSRKTYRTNDLQQADVLENLRATFHKEFPIPSAATKALAFEIGGFYYAFLVWKIKRGEHSFTYHKKNGVFALLSVFIFLIVAETFALHLLISYWNNTAAWILTALSAYFLFQLFAHGKAILLRPIEISDKKLFIRCGLIGDTAINLNEIEELELVDQPFEIRKEAINLTPLGKFTQPNVKIVLREKAILNGFYGFKKNFNTIFLAIDEVEKFRTTFEYNLENNKKT